MTISFQNLIFSATGPDPAQSAPGQTMLVSLVAMHTLNYISIPLNYIVHVQVSCSSSPTHYSEMAPGRGGEVDEVEKVLVGVAQW